jgi:N-methylhydantoinase A/oxoprolinase/acetone carboxylase beta subunit
MEAQEIPYEPKAPVSGQLEITGKEIVPVDAEEIAQVARRMVSENMVKAFAVSGYGGAINPAHELQVKRIIREVTGLSVTCGHELSGLLNFKTRACTAMLNARIIPSLTKLFRDIEQILARLEISAPIAVVKGDGTLMSIQMAVERPVESILSGPAAGAAGARHLTGLKDAIVVDMGGTTTDTAELSDGVVRVCEEGANVGGNQTHVRALEVSSVGLGADSFIHYQKGTFAIGPRRVLSISYVGAKYEHIDKALDFFDHHLDRYIHGNQSMQIFVLTGSVDHLTLTPLEEGIVALLASRPYPVDELIQDMGVRLEGGLEISRLEELFLVQRCGLTPTDLLHATNRFERWNKNAALRLCKQVARLCKMNPDALVEHLLELAVNRLTMELLKRLFNSETKTEGLDSCPICRSLVNNLLMGGDDRYQMHIDLKRPLIGIGAPIHYFLPQAAKILGTEVILPRDADIANAVGAITNEVVIQRQVRIVSNQMGEFMIEGLAGAPQFAKFDEADQNARKELIRMVHELARAAGTSERRILLQAEDKVSNTADGSEVFLGRTILARLSGPPDLIGHTQCR